MTTATVDTSVNAYGIPTDPKTASEAVKSGTLKLTENPDEVNSGVIVEKFKITVSTEDKDTKETTVHYQSDSQPFAWEKVANFPAVFANEKAELTGDQIDFLGAAFPGEAQGKVLLRLVDLYNESNRSAKKANEYQRIMNHFKPITEEDKAAAVENAVRNVAKAFTISLAKAREMVLAMNAK